jgi:hypothetical protein
MALWMNKKIIKHRRGKDGVLVERSRDAGPGVHAGRVGLNSVCCFVRSTGWVVLTIVVSFVKEFFSVIFAVFFCFLLVANCNDLPIYHRFDVIRIFFLHQK